MIDRLLKLSDKNSFFLLGPRQTGKSTLIKSHLTKPTWQLDLLQSELFFKYSKDPSLFRKEAEQKIKHEDIQTIFIDEIQRIPDLLNEIQALMSKSSCQFILTGSSARKLKRGGANLLAGRALVEYLFPFVYHEIKDKFELDDALLFGSLPPVFGKTREEKINVLSAYANTYLREEIQSEGIARNLGNFSRFLDLAAVQAGELLSFSSISRECHLAIKTVQSYYEILEDTLIGFRLEPWRKSLRKRLVGHPKFYFFDLGVANAINKRLTGSIDPAMRGKLFEQFIVLETYRWIKYRKSESNLFFWRTNHGAEVDLLIEKHGRITHAFEIKSSANIAGAHLSGLRAFQDDHGKVPCAIISTVEHAYELEGIKILPWKTYLGKLDHYI